MCTKERPTRKARFACKANLSVCVQSVHTLYSQHSIVLYLYDESIYNAFGAMKDLNFEMSLISINFNCTGGHMSIRCTVSRTD